MKQRMKQRMDGRANKLVIESTNEWTNEEISEWMNWLTNEAMNFSEGWNDKRRPLLFRRLFNFKVIKEILKTTQSKTHSKATLWGSALNFIKIQYSESSKLCWKHDEHRANKKLQVSLNFKVYKCVCADLVSIQKKDKSVN